MFEQLLNFLAESSAATNVGALLFLMLLCVTGLSALRRLLRHLSIWLRGWPPPHVDGDGNPVCDCGCDYDDDDDGDNDDGSGGDSDPVGGPPHPKACKSLPRLPKRNGILSFWA